jgi:hypothetical protein
VGADERNAWHKGIDVYWQDNAWADTNFSVEWVQKTLKFAVSQAKLKKFVLFADNLEGFVLSLEALNEPRVLNFERHVLRFWRY